MTTTTTTTIAAAVGAAAGMDTATLQGLLAPGIVGTPKTRRFCAAAVPQTDGDDPIVGVTYRCDYRAEEEFGLRDLRRVIVGDDHRAIDPIPTASDHVLVCTDKNAIAITTMPNHTHEFAWGDPIVRGNYADYWIDHVGYAQGTVARWELEHETVPELRQRAKTLGITPLPARKNDLINTIITHPDLPRDTPGAWPGWLHHGDALILRADYGPAADVIARLCDAARANTLTFAPASGPFHTGCFLADARDITTTFRDHLERERAAFDTALEDANRIVTALNNDGWNLTPVRYANTVTGGWRYCLEGRAANGNKIGDWIHATDLDAMRPDTPGFGDRVQGHLDAVDADRKARGISSNSRT